MKVSGTANLNATPAQVWAALNDPAVLVRTIPGCEQLETVGTDRYRMRVSAGVASIKGTYLGDVELADHVPYTAFTLKASGSGAPGTVSADVKVTLDGRPDGTTLLSYDADAVVGGTVGGVGQRVLGGVARRLAGEFFQAVDGELTSSPVPTGEATTTGTGTTAVPGLAAAPPDGAGPETVFTRPRLPSEGRTVQVDVRNSLPAVALGAAIALAGVLIGWRMGRESRP